MPVRGELTQATVTAIEEGIRSFRSANNEVEERVLAWVRELVDRGATQPEIVQFFSDRGIGVPRRWLREKLRDPGTRGSGHSPVRQSVPPPQAGQPATAAVPGEARPRRGRANAEDF